MKCPNCGQEQPDDVQVCSNCGTKMWVDVVSTPVPTEGEVKTVIQPTVTTVSHVEYAGFWLRFLAFFIDDAILAFIGWLLASIFSPLSALFSGIIGWLYFAIMESSEGQATLGKQVVGIKVTDINGNRISFGRATGRYFAKIISTLTLCIGYMMAGWTAKKQALHDMIADTLVVKA